MYIFGLYSDMWIRASRSGLGDPIYQEPLDKMISKVSCANIITGKNQPETKIGKSLWTDFGSFCFLWGTTPMTILLFPLLLPCNFSLTLALSKPLRACSLLTEPNQPWLCVFSPALCICHCVQGLAC